MLSTDSRRDAACDCGRACARGRAGFGKSTAVLGAVLTVLLARAAVAAPTTSAVPTESVAPTPAPSSGAAGSNVVHVHMRDIAFVPKMLAISPGTTIEWTNDDDMAHTVTSGIDRDDGVWTSSPPVPPGGTFSIVLQKPGTYRYFCKPHVFSAAMHATIVVSGAGSNVTSRSRPRG